ncbi:unnamed protein product [Prunus armeniaca]
MHQCYKLQLQTQVFVVSRFVVTASFENQIPQPQPQMRFGSSYLKCGLVSHDCDFIASKMPPLDEGEYLQHVCEDFGQAVNIQKTRYRWFTLDEWATSTKKGIRPKDKGKKAQGLRYKAQESKTHDPFLSGE